MSNEERNERAQVDFTLMGSVERLNNAVEKLTDTVNNMRLTMVENYVKKTECEKCVVDNKNMRTQLIGWIIGQYAIIIAGFAFIVTKSH